MAVSRSKERRKKSAIKQKSRSVSKRKKRVIRPVKRAKSRKKITRRQLESDFKKIIAEERRLRAEAEAKVKQIQMEVVRMFIRPPETTEERAGRLSVQFARETAGLLPKKWQTMKGALELWAARNNWSSSEMWAEYRKRYAPGFFAARTAIALAA